MRGMIFDSEAYDPTRDAAMSWRAVAAAYEAYEAGATAGSLLAVVAREYDRSARSVAELNEPALSPKRNEAGA